MVQTPIVYHPQLVVHQLTGNFGPWILVSRKTRSGRGRGGVRPTTGRQPASITPNSSWIPQVGIETHSGLQCWRILKGKIIFQFKKRQIKAPTHNMSENLPRIRTNLHQYKDSAPQRTFDAEAEHTVVRGYNKGKNIVNTVVGQEDEQPESSQPWTNNVLMGDPLDVPRIFVNLAKPPDEAMEDLEYAFGRNDLAAIAHSRS
nr:uncharacterized protein LOC109179535 isoform X2 [Ipomoea trifida]